MTAELQPQVQKNNLIAPQEWTYCEKEEELTKFAQKNAK